MIKERTIHFCEHLYSLIFLRKLLRSTKHLTGLQGVVYLILNCILSFVSDITFRIFILILFNDWYKIKDLTKASFFGFFKIKFEIISTIIKVLNCVNWTTRQNSKIQNIFSVLEFQNGRGGNFTSNFIQVYLILSFLSYLTVWEAFLSISF